MARDSDYTVIGVANFIEFEVVINVSSNPEIEEEFELLGGGGYDFLPYPQTSPVISGVSNYSAYKKTIKSRLISEKEYSRIVDPKKMVNPL